MGNSETKPNQQQNHKGEDPLRDYATEIAIPSHISKPTSNLLLAYTEGHYHPCIILNRATNISDGYLVFFLHSQEETEIPCSNVIGNFKALVNCTVSFLVDGRSFSGRVCDLNSDEKNEATNFFISCGDHCAWVSFPFIFLTVEQARQICA